MTNRTQFKRTSPEAEGIPSAALLDFIQALEQHDHPLDAVQGFMLLRHGHVAAEGWWAPYTPHSPHILYSLSKSFASTAIGLAVAEGLLTVDDPVLKFFPTDAPLNPSENLKAMRVRHLLSMNTGHQEDTTGKVFQRSNQHLLFGLARPPQEHVPSAGADNWPRTFLSLPVENQPGSWFVYNTAATYMLSAIITVLTGETLLDYLRPRLFDPLGIEDPTWETDPRGINLGGTGLHIKTEDIARFGQLYLQQGLWAGQRILPAAWVAEATKATSDNRNTQTNPDWTMGYGYQFWRCQHNCYRGDGAFGQYCIVMPEQETVLAIISGVRDMQRVLDKVWAHLLPAMQPSALPANPQAYNQLCAKLASLSLPLAQGQPTSPLAAKWSGTKYTLDSNDYQFADVAIEFGDANSTLRVRDELGEHQIAVGHGTWRHNTVSSDGSEAAPLAASGAWQSENTYEVRVCYTQREIGSVLRFQYGNGELRLTVEPNVSWGSTEMRSISGHSIA